MTNNEEIFKLNNYTAEDIGDVVAKIQKSFCIKFDKTAFKNVANFGELCDVIMATINRDCGNGCTKQQAFYKIRKAVSLSQSIDESQITLDTNLSILFPSPNRRKQVNKFQTLLGVRLRFLTYPNWITLGLVAAFIAAFVAFLFNWKIAIVGIAFVLFALKLANTFGKDLELETVRQLTEKAVRDHYIGMRRSQLTINRAEILDIIKDIFRHDLDIEKKYLTRDATFDWVKS